MKMEFRLLIVDDRAEQVDAAVGILKDHLESKGFELQSRVASDLSKEGVRALARREGKDYDLVMVDYNLGREDTDGADAAARLRRELKYTDMVFYSSNPELDLHAKMADHELSGVFIARRDNLDEALKGLANTVIGKVVDLTHMRGVAMAEVAEMDVIMERTLLRVVEAGGEQFESGIRRTLRGVEKEVRQLSAKVESRLASDGVAGVVRDGQLFSSARKYRAIKRLASLLATPPVDALKVLGSYETEILSKRNRLAHSEEDVGEGGVVVLRSIKPDETEIINDEWMVEFRLQLRRHRGALASVCSALDQEARAPNGARGD